MIVIRARRVAHKTIRIFRCRGVYQISELSALTRNNCARRGEERNGEKNERKLGVSAPRRAAAVMMCNVAAADADESKS